MSEVTKRALAAVAKKSSSEKTAYQDNYKRYYRGLRHKPDDLLLSF